MHIYKTTYEFTTYIFTLNEKYDVKRSILKYVYIRYSPFEIYTIKTAISHIHFFIPKEVSVISSLIIYLVVYFDALHAATNNRHGNDISLVNLGPIALFSTYRLTTNSGKHLEDISHAHIVSLFCKLIKRTKNSDELSFGFDRDQNRRQRELTNNKNQKGYYHIGSYLKDIFGFAEHKEKATYGLGHDLTFTSNSDNSVLNNADATELRKIKIISFEWYMSLYIPSIPQEAILSKVVLRKVPTQLQFVKKRVFMKKVDTQNLSTFELGTQEGTNVPIWTTVGFQQWNRQDSKTLKNDSSHKPPVTSNQCFILAEKYPNSAILPKYDDDFYSQGFGQIEEAFRALTNDDILQPFISNHDFRSSNDGNDFGYNFYVFDIWYQKSLEAAQPIEVEFNFSENIPAGIYADTLVLTNKLAGITSDSQRHFDLMYVIFNFFMTLSFCFNDSSNFFNKLSI